jgi:glycosyltransferase involved in cell wall biosynthesis
LGLAYQLQAFFILFGSNRVIVPVVWQERRLHDSFPWWKRKILRIPVGPSIWPNSNSASPRDSALLTLATFGTGHPWWQYEKALEILRGLLDQGISARLICLGDIAGTNPPYYKQLLHKSAELHLENSVEWTGRLEEQDLSRHLQSADLFLALQKAGVTARSTALISALAHGLAVIATDGPDADRWLLESGALAVVPPDDLAAVLETSLRLAQDASGRKALGDRARAFYQREFSWEKISAEFLKALQ